MSKKTAAKVAEFLLQIEAVKLNPDNPFTWTSGLRSPIYCDNRISLSHPKVRSFIKKKLAQLIRKEFEEAECIAGVATAGIAPGALVADQLELPFVYVRAEAKSHGMKNQIEGRLAPGTPVIVVEDLVSTGKSSLAAVQALREAGADVLGLVSIFSYGFDKAEKAFEEADCRWYSLSNYNTLLKKAYENGYIQKDQEQTLKEWRKNPEAWSEAQNVPA